ncbi:MAG: squalene--hopene cyclase [Alphaproteobacteria bacterium]|nr:squalene--hopene cyclase [Alphaproteobacteria bacterium]
MDRTIDEALGALLAEQRDDGHWAFELEADVTIPAEYILLKHYLDETDPGLEAKIGRYIRARQGAHGGWPLFEAGDMDISASVKAYWALKMIGDDIGADHMATARAAIRAHGGAARVNVFTRITLALFGEVPWHAVPVMPVELMLLPQWFPFHLSKVSYWSRTVIAPLLILMALKPSARNPRGVSLEELFLTPPNEEANFIDSPTGDVPGQMFLILDKVLRRVEFLFPRRSRRKAIEAATQFVTERLNSEDGLGGIFPAMANAVMAFDALGYAPDHPDMVTAKTAVDKLVVVDGDTAYCQPSLAPIWDTALSGHAVMEAGLAGSDARMIAACDWLRALEITETRGDWVSRRPELPPGGWAFQYRNDHYPDVDDTAVVAMALHRAGVEADDPVLQRTVNWIIGMQSSNGGWGSFDAENTHYYLNNIPFADHGALLDPPTADVSARCLSMLSQLGYGRNHPAVARGVKYLESEQETDGSWYGRWGVNYIYGTWSALCALNAVGIARDSDTVRRAVAWLKQRQRDDGGWGEDCASYWEDRRGEVKDSTPSQTSWALLGLMAAGEAGSEAVQRGIDYLLAQPRKGANWQEHLWTGAGFPRVFFLKYHGYSSYFPLWALARYKFLKASNSDRVGFGM